MPVFDVFQPAHHTLLQESARSTTIDEVAKQNIGETNAADRRITIVPA